MTVSIEPSKYGLYQPTKGGFPVRYGERVQITTPELTLELDREGRIRYLTGRTREWPSPLEYLKRTDGDDWVYYSLGEYADHLSLYGEYYLPCPDYPTNRPLGGEPFRRAPVIDALRTWPEALREIRAQRAALPSNLRPFVDRLAVNDPQLLAERARKLHDIIGSAIPVLPPDARHVDYDVVPLIVADGCRYGCSFCCVNDGRGLVPRPMAAIRAQIQALKSWLGRQTGNVQGLFLGLHDALSVKGDLLRRAAEEAHHRLGFDDSPFSRPQLYLFGSVDSLLDAEDRLFEWLGAAPWSTFINVGLESADGETLRRLGKPLTPDRVEAGFRRMLDVNARWPNVEVTANFVFLSDDGRSDDAMLELMSRHLSRRSSRGTCYLSPLMSGATRPRMGRRPLLQRIHRLQRAAPLPLHLYLIQRL